MYLNQKQGTILVKELQGLTLTWDVFKFIVIITELMNQACLTLTWDVFKYEFWINNINKIGV